MLLTGSTNLTMESISCLNFTATAQPGVFALHYMLLRQEQLYIGISTATSNLSCGSIDVGPYVDYNIYGGTLSINDTDSVAGQPLSLQLTSNTSHSAMSDTGNDGWMLLMKPPGADKFMQLGLMQPAAESAGLSYWTMPVSGDQLTQVRNQPLCAGLLQNCR